MGPLSKGDPELRPPENLPEVLYGLRYETRMYRVPSGLLQKHYLHFCQGHYQGIAKAFLVHPLLIELWWLLSFVGAKPEISSFADVATLPRADVDKDLASEMLHS